MSVEEARKALGWMFYGYLPDADMEAGFDRLILEVQAAMPCAVELKYGKACPEHDPLYDEATPEEWGWCQSCKAREALGEHVPA